jgi:hypothetical protein
MPAGPGAALTLDGDVDGDGRADAVEVVVSGRRLPRCTVSVTVSTAAATMRARFPSSGGIPVLAVPQELRQIDGRPGDEVVVTLDGPAPALVVLGARGGRLIRLGTFSVGPSIFEGSGGMVLGPGQVLGGADCVAGSSIVSSTAHSDDVSTWDVVRHFYRPTASGYRIVPSRTERRTSTAAGLRAFPELSPPVPFTDCPAR